MTFEQAAVGIALVSIEGSWLSANKTLCDIVGYSADELLRTTLQGVAYPDDFAATLDCVHQLLDGDADCLHAGDAFFTQGWRHGLDQSYGGHRSPRRRRSRLFHHGDRGYSAAQGSRGGRAITGTRVARGAASGQYRQLGLERCRRSPFVVRGSVHDLRPRSELAAGGVSRSQAVLHAGELGRTGCGRGLMSCRWNPLCLRRRSGACGWRPPLDRCARRGDARRPRERDRTPWDGPGHHRA